MNTIAVRGPQGRIEPSPTPAGRPPKPILIVDDDQGLCRLIAKTLRREGWEPVSAQSGDMAKAWLSRNSAELMLVDLKLQDGEGPGLVDDLSRSGRATPFIVITGQGDERVAVEMMKRGALDYVVKDEDFLQFLPTVVRRAIERIDQERRLAEAEAQIHLVRSVVEQGFSAVLIATEEKPEPRVAYANPAFERATGYSSIDVVGKPLRELAGLRGIPERLLQGMKQGEKLLEGTYTYQGTAGERWGEWRVGPVMDRAGTISHWLIIFRDITERRRLEREILEISDRERQRIGQDLHDGLCQHLAGIELMSRALEQQLTGKSKAGAARAADIARYVRDAIAQTRLLARGLSPVTLEAEGLIGGLKELAANATRLFGIPCDLVCPATCRVPEISTAIHLFRIAQEAVYNAIRHGKATKVQVTLSANGKRGLLSVADDGVGMSSPLKHEGMGLRIMQYRAGVLGGTLAIRSNAGKGTVISCTVPAGHLESTS